MAARNHAQLLQEAVGHYDAGRLQEAEVLCRGLLQSKPKDVDALQLLGLVLFQRREWNRAANCYRKCRRLLPREARFPFLLGKTRTFEGRLDEALKAYDTAIALRPGYVDAKIWKAATLERRGDAGEAQAICDALVAVGIDSPDLAELRWRLLTQAGEHSEAARIVGEALTRSGVPSVVRGNLAFLHGQALEKAGEYGDAFAAFQKGNRIYGSAFRPKSYADELQRVIDAFSAERLARVPRATSRSEQPIFVAGLPRSGTTLVEQIVQSHPKAEGGGELKTLFTAETRMAEVIGTSARFPTCLAELGQSHVDTLGEQAEASLREIAPDALRLVDKNVDNYKRLGVAALVLPGARVIHIHRDPMDVGASCFFSPLPPQGQPWSTSLENIGFAIRQYERLMEHWREVQGLPLLDVSYEELVQEPERVTREIVDFCGLPWDDACLRHHESRRFAKTLSYGDVRKPVYRSSIGRHRSFGEHLAPLRKALERD